MTPVRCRYTLRMVGIQGAVRLPRRWLNAAGVALVTALAVVGAYVEANPVHHYGGLHLGSPPPLAAYLLLAVPAIALIWRNSRPVPVLGLTVGGAVGWAALGQIDGAALVPVIVGVYWVALTCPRRVAVAAGLAGAVAIFVTEGLLGPFGWFGGPNATMWPELLAAGAIGAYVAARRQWLAAESDRAARAEQAREEETRRRVDAERMRIARELHDVVAHSMAMINVQATAAGMQLASDPASAAEAIQAIRRASKSGLRELRTILEVLRQADGGSPAVPVPDLRAIAALVEATSAAGTPTTLEPAAGSPSAPGCRWPRPPADQRPPRARQALPWPPGRSRVSRDQGPARRRPGPGPGRFPVHRRLGARHRGGRGGCRRGGRGRTGPLAAGRGGADGHPYAWHRRAGGNPADRC
jgi:Histidine kinase